MRSAASRYGVDDGKIGGVIRSVNRTSVRVEITQARPEGEILG